MREDGRKPGGLRRTTAAFELDRTIHEPLRLGIVTSLATDGTRTFVQLKAALGASDGNLSVHARKLETAGYVSVQRGFEGRVPRTEFRLTHAGRKAFDAYLERMDAIIRAARSTPPDATT